MNRPNTNIPALNWLIARATINPAVADPDDASVVMFPAVGHFKGSVSVEMAKELNAALAKYPTRGLGIEFDGLLVRVSVEKICKGYRSVAVDVSFTEIAN